MPLEYCRLGDLITFQRGFDLPVEQMKPGDVPVIGSNGIIGYHNEYTAIAPVITIGRSGNIGNPRITYSNAWCHNTTLFVKEYHDVDPIFMYYYLQQFDFKNYAGGSAVPTLNRNIIHEIEIQKPPNTHGQKVIGKMLKLFDDKIELLQTINDNLGGAALAS